MLEVEEECLQVERHEFRGAQGLACSTVTPRQRDRHRQLKAVWNRIHPEWSARLEHCVIDLTFVDRFEENVCRWNFRKIEGLSI